MARAALPPLPPDPSTGPARLIATASWTDRLPHEGTLTVTLVPKATDGIRERRTSFDKTLSLPGFRMGAGHLHSAYVDAEWARIQESLLNNLSHEAVTLLKPHLGAELLSPLPEVVSHTDPLDPDSPLTLTLRLSLQPAAPDPLQGDQVWPPDPAQEAIRQAAAAAGGEPEPASSSSSPPTPYPGAPIPPLPAGAPQSPPPPPGLPAAGPGPAPAPAPSTHPQPPPHKLQDPGGHN